MVGVKKRNGESAMPPPDRNPQLCLFSCSRDDTSTRVTSSDTSCSQLGTLPFPGAEEGVARSTFLLHDNPRLLLVPRRNRLQQGIGIGNRRKGNTAPSYHPVQKRDGQVLEEKRDQVSCPAPRRCASRRGGRVIRLLTGIYSISTTGSAISAEEKQAIRPRLLAMVDESDLVLAKNVALCIGKIARLDYGIEWYVELNGLFIRKS